MARSKKPNYDFTPLWRTANDLFAAGAPEFVDAIRALPDADGVGAFAARWYADVRPAAREFLRAYLDRPLNAPRHEPLVKRLFKLAEAAGDDEAMGWFLVAFDRAARRALRTRRRYIYERRGRGTSVRVEEDEILRPAFRQLPRNDEMIRYVLTRNQNPLATLGLTETRLFSNATRNYLRRRAWRYFRLLGRKDPPRYVPAAARVLLQYTDDDVADAVALLDNWGLVHVLFHHCPALEARVAGWVVAGGHTLAELAPAPAHNKLWRAAPDVVLDLIPASRCRPVRQWAIRWLERESPATLDRLTLEQLLGWLKSGHADLVRFAADRLVTMRGLEDVAVDRWIAIIESAPPEILDTICTLVGTNVRADRVSLPDAVRFAVQRPVPVARLGFGWLQGKRPAGDADMEALFSLREAGAEPVRPDLVRWAAGVLGESPAFRPEWVLEFLDSRHADVREIGWAWMRTDPRAKDDATVWQRMLESPFDDVRLNAVAYLEEITKAERDPADLFRPELLRLLWATVLLNIHRGGRQKPVILRQMLTHLDRKPADVAHLLPVLAVAVRSVRGPEFRSGLTAIIRLVDRRPDLEPAVAAAFPELTREAVV